MKDTIVTVSFLLACTFLFAQKEADMKVEYQPNHKYVETQHQTIHVERRYSGSKHALESLISQNIKNPDVQDTRVNKESEISTGPMVNDSFFAITMVLAKSGNPSVPDGTTIYGSQVKGGTPVFDSVAGAGMGAAFKKQFLIGMQAVLSQVSMPERKIKAGEKFTQQSPLSIPLGASSLDMVINTTYKLKSIANGIAYFDLDLAYTMKSDILSSSTSASGSGKGKMSYSVKDNFYTQTTINTNMVLNMKMDELNISVKMESDILQDYVVSAINK